MSRLSSPAFLRSLGTWPVWQQGRERLRSAWSPHALICVPAQADADAIRGPNHSAQPATVTGPEATATLAAWAQWCEAHAGACCELGLSGHWLWTTLVDTLAVAQAPSEAAAQWAHYLGLPAQELDAAWVWRSLRLSQASLVCAMPRLLLEGLKEVAAAHHVRLQWLGPWWLRGAQVWMASDVATCGSCLLIQEPGLLTCLERVEAEGRVQLVRVWAEAAAWSGQPGAAQASAAATSPSRLVRLSDAAGPVPVARLDGTAASVLQDGHVGAMLFGQHAAWGATP